MDTYFALKTRMGFSISENMVIDFKAHIDSENTTIPKMITQFMVNYIEHLDSSFLENENNHHDKSLKKKYLLLTLPEDICRRFKQKTEQEGTKSVKVIEQFIQNYNNFMENC